MNLNWCIWLVVRKSFVALHGLMNVKYIHLISVQYKMYNLLNHIQMLLSHGCLGSHKIYGKNNLKIMHVTCSQSINLTPGSANSFFPTIMG